MSPPETMSDSYHMDRLNRHDDVLTELRIAVARIEERTKTILDVIEEGECRRAALEERIEPIADTVERWKGALALLALMSGIAGAVITVAFKKLFGLDHA
jgi:hypothetical protein